MTDYRDFADHPRYGKTPRVTGLNPRSLHGGVFLHGHSPDACRIPNTAIKADTSRQVPATVAVTHYFDVVRECRDCCTAFIFFACEQKYWYEDLGFPLEADCVRCAACRKQQRGLELAVKRYEALHQLTSPNNEELLELAECAVQLVAHEVFSPRVLEKVRALLKRVERSLPEETTPNYPTVTEERLAELRIRVGEFTTENDG